MERFWQCSIFVKNLAQLLILAVFTFAAQLVSAENIIYTAGEQNRYAAIDPETGEQKGIVQLKANNQVTFFYGSSIRLHGTYRISGRNAGGRALVDRISAQLSDTENTSLLVNTVRLEIAFGGVEAARIKNSSGVNISLKLWLNTAKEPRVMNSVLRRL